MAMESEGHPAASDAASTIAIAAPRHRVDAQDRLTNRSVSQYSGGWAEPGKLQPPSRACRARVWLGLDPAGRTEVEDGTLAVQDDGENLGLLRDPQRLAG
jgi:hypothetical protein